MTGVFRPAAEHLNDSFDLFGAADDRVDLGLGGPDRSDCGRIIDSGMVGALHAALGLFVAAGQPPSKPEAPPSMATTLLADLIRISPHAGEDLGGDAFALTDQSQEDMLGADVIDAPAIGFILR